MKNNIPPWFPPRENGYSQRTWIKMNAVIKKVPEGYIAYLPDTPGVNTQGSTEEETLDNLVDALLILKRI